MTGPGAWPPISVWRLGRGQQAPRGEGRFAPMKRKGRPGRAPREHPDSPGTRPPSRPGSCQSPTGKGTILIQGKAASTRRLRRPRMGMRVRAGQPKLSQNSNAQGETQGLLLITNPDTIEFNR